MQIEDFAKAASIHIVQFVSNPYIWAGIRTHDLFSGDHCAKWLIYLPT
jgi:hypothetical protein